MGTDIQLTPTEGMPPVTTDTSGSQQSGGTEQIVQSPEARAAQGQLETAAGDVASAQDRVNPATAIEGQAAGQDLLQNEATSEAAERQKLIDAKKPFIDEAKRKTQEAEDRFLNHKFYDWWTSQPVGDRIIARLQMGLNAFANTRMGIAGNEKADQIKQIIDRDFEGQKIALHSKEQAAEWRRQGVKDLYGELQSELAALDIKQAKAHEAVAAKAEAMALRAKIPEAQAKQWVEVTKANEAAAQKRAEGAQRYEKHATDHFERSQSHQLTSTKPGKQAPVFDANGNEMGQTEPTAANKVNTELGVARSAHDSLEKLIASYDNGPTVDPLHPIDSAKAFINQGRERNALMQDIKSLQPQIKGFTRLTAEDMKVFDAIIGGHADAFLATDSGKKLAQDALQRLKETAADTARAHGIKPTANILKRGNAPAEGVKSVSPNSAAMIDWLQANPNNPKAPLVRAKLKALGAL